MSEQILKLIYDFTKNYNDPSSKQALDENNKNLSIVIKNGNINLTLTIDPSQKNKSRVVLKGDIPTPMNKPSGCAFRTRCPIAKPECANDIPPLIDTGNEHWIACPYWEEKF